MTALQALRPAASGVVRNPILVLITAVFGLSQLPNLLVQPTQPILAALISLGTTGVLVLVLPFFQGGLIGMASEAIAGRTSLGTLVAEGKANYVSLLLGYFVLLAINLVFGFVVFFGAFIGVVGISMGGSGESFSDAGLAGGDLTLLAVVAIIALGLVLAYFLVTFFIQFYAHAIVLDDTELVAGFRRSVGLVRSNLLSVFGYTVLLGVGSLLVGILAAGASLLVGPQAQGAGSPLSEVATVDPTPALVAALAIGYVLLTGLFGAFYATYSVAFYESIRRSPDADRL